MKNKIQIWLPLLLILCISVFFIFSKWKSGISDSEYSDAVRKNLKAIALDIPGKQEFAGENVPMDLFYVRESFDRELITNVYWHSSTLLMLKRAHRFFPVIEPILARNGIPDDFKYIVVAESNLTNAQSPAGAIGYWQFLKATGIQYGLEINDEIDERYNLEKATEAACRYLTDSYKNYNNWTLAAASYNSGPDNIRKPMSVQKENNFYDLLLNPETSRYIYRILAIKELFSDPEKYGFHYRKKDLYPVIPVNKVMVDSSIRDLSDFAHNLGINYKILKEFNPWLRKSNLTNKNRKVYILDIPNREDLLYSRLIDSTSNTANHRLQKSQE
jgi:membrane-bound lytic murein transglycosylase D